MRRLSQSHTRQLLENALRDFHTKFHRDRDPIQWPHKFSDRADREVAAFFSAILAYGNVSSILSGLAKIFAELGPRPSHGIFARDLEERLEPFVHRFTRGSDIAIVSYWLRSILEKHGSLEKFYGGENSPREGLGSFVVRMHKLPLPKTLRSAYKYRERNLHYLVSSPQQGSSCKRLNLFLRWVVRPNDGIDLGIWNSVSPSGLMLPIDTHVLKIIRELGWTRSQTARWKTSEEATKQLRVYCPEDPIRYDFALCHLSMAGFTLKKYNAQMER